MEAVTPVSDASRMRSAVKRDYGIRREFTIFCEETIFCEWNTLFFECYIPTKEYGGIRKAVNPHTKSIIEWVDRRIREFKKIVNGATQVEISKAIQVLVKDFRERKGIVWIRV